MRSLPLWLSTRLTHYSGGTGKTGAVIAVLGVAFALAVMEITLAVTSGFKKEITNKLEGFIAPVTITSTLLESNEEREQFIHVTPEMLEPISRLAPDATPIPVLCQSGMLKTDTDFAAIMLKGYEPDYDADFERGNIVKGQWLDPADRRGLVISTVTAEKLGLDVGSKVNAVFFVKDAVRARPLKVVGLYRSGLSEFDNIMAYTTSATIRAINHVDSTYITGIELYGLALRSSGHVAKALQEAYLEYAVANGDVTYAYTVESIAQQGSQYLNWLDLLDTNVVVIFILMAMVASSTLISALFIQVLERVNTIGLLRALGARNRTVSRIFVYLSLRLVGAGMLLGNIIGLGFIIVQSMWHPVALDPEMYYLDSVPVNLSPLSMVILNVSVFAAAWIIMLVPARIATHLSPAKTLRFD